MTSGQIELMKLKVKTIESIEARIEELKLTAKITKETINDPYSNISLVADSNAHKGVLSIPDYKEVMEVISDMALRKIELLKVELSEL